MEPSRLVSILRRSWLVVLVAALVAGALGGWLSSRSSPRFEASTTLLVGPINTDTATLQAAGRLAQTYAELASSRATLEAATEGRGIPEVGRAEVSASASDVTRLLTIEVHHPNADAAADIANALGVELESLATGETGNAGREGQLVVIEPAAPSAGAVSRQDELVAVLLAFAAAVVALGVLLLVELLSPNVRSAKELSELVDVPLLAKVCSNSWDRRFRPRRQRRRERTAYRVAATSLELVSLDQPATRVVSVVGTSDADDSSANARQLATAFAELGRRVAFLDADRPPSGAGRRGGTRGEVLEIELDARRPVRGRRETSDAAEFLEQALREVDLVVVHGGVPSGSPAALVWAGLADAVVVVVWERRTRRADVTDTLSLLRRVGARTSGVLLDQGRPRPRPLPVTLAALMSAAPGTPAPVPPPPETPADPAPAPPSASAPPGAPPADAGAPASSTPAPSPPPPAASPSTARPPASVSAEPASLVASPSGPSIVLATATPPAAPVATAPSAPQSPDSATPAPAPVPSTPPLPSSVGPAKGRDPADPEGQRALRRRRWKQRKRKLKRR